jgi:hypothetical protein
MEIKMTSKQYLKKIQLGYYQYIKCNSVFVKTVKNNLLNGKSEIIKINITN